MNYLILASLLGLTVHAYAGGITIDLPTPVYVPYVEPPPTPSPEDPSAARSVDSVTTAKSKQPNAVKQMLEDPKKRELVEQTNQPLKQYEGELNYMTMDQDHKEQVYDLSNQMMDTILRKANGSDAEKKKLLELAKENPEEFLNSMFTEEQKAALRKLSSDMGQQPPP